MDKKKAEQHIRSVAKGKGITYEDCCKAMEESIREASKHPSPLFVKSFGNRTSGLEKFICKLLDMIYEEELKKRNTYEA